MIKRLLAGLLTLALLAAPALAADRKPVVIGSSGRQQEIQSGDTATMPAAKITGISGSTQCVQASSAGLLSGFGSGCTTPPGGTSGQLQYNNAGALGGFTLGNDCSFSVPNITCTKTGGVSFGYFATGTDASNLTGSVNLARFGSQSANVVLAGPTSGGSATPSWRALVGADLPAPASSTLGGVKSLACSTSQWFNALSTSGAFSCAQPAASDVSGLAASATTDTTNASNISSGTLPAARLPNPSATTLGGVESLAAATHRFLTSISTAGVPANGQPACTDLSDAVALCNSTNASALTGTVSVNRFNSGTSADSNHYLAGDGTWKLVGAGLGLANPSFLGSAQLQQTSSIPSNSDPVGSFSLYTGGIPRAYLNVSVPTAVTFVQSAIAGLNSYATTLGATPTSGNFLVASAWSNTGTPAANTGWNVFATHLACSQDPNMVLLWHKVGVGESTSQTPATGSTGQVWGAEVIEVSGMASSWGPNLESTSFVCQNMPGNPPGFMTTSNTATSSMSTNLALNFVGTTATTSFPGTGANQPSQLSWNGGWTNTSVSTSGSSANAGSGLSVYGLATQSFTGFGSSVTAQTTITDNFSNSRTLGQASAIVLLGPGGGGETPLSFLSTIKNAGAVIETNASSINCSTGMACSTDGAGGVTMTATGTGSVTSVAVTVPSDETVSGSPITAAGTLAITRNSQSANTVLAGPTSGGVATPAYRGLVSADLPVGSTSQLGAMKCDGTSITCTAGLLVATGGGGGTTNNYYAGSLIPIATCQPVSTTLCTFSAIPQGYTDLFISGIARSGASGTGSDFIGMVFNSDTGSNYGRQDTTAASSTVSTNANTSQTAAYLAAFPKASDVANLPVVFTAEIPGYSNTTFAKAYFSHSTTFNNSTVSSLLGDGIEGFWNSTAAITSISITVTTSYVTGSQITLYGRSASNVTVNPQPGLPVISEVVTSGSQSSVTVSSIPGTYRDIEIVLSGRGTVAANQTQLNVTVNGSSSAIYSVQRVYGQAATTVLADQVLAGTSLGASSAFAAIPGATAQANQTGFLDLRLFNYANSSQWKSGSFSNRQPNSTSTDNSFTLVGSVQLDTTAAITSLTISAASGAFADGTVVDVYGIGGSPTATLPLVPPQGRLTLTSGIPVMTADATAQTTIYYAPYQGSLLPIGNVMYNLTSQLSFGLNTTAHASGSLYDVFAYNAASVPSLCTGPAWTNSTTRAAAIIMNNGIWGNSAALTCTLTSSTSTTTIAIGQGTYLGTFYATANGQTGVQFAPSPAAGGNNSIVGLCNAYNRRPISSRSMDSTFSWGYTSGTWRATDNSASNRVTMVDCLGQIAVTAKARVLSSVNTGNSDFWSIGVDRDSTSATPVIQSQSGGGGAVQALLSSEDVFLPSLGLHYYQGVESHGSVANTLTFFGNSNYQAVIINAEM